jgi:DNA (cytosine-5)-methyltransferase 1
MLWFNKSRRAQSETDYETWVEGGVVPTLNAFDNGDVRATTIVFHPHRSDGFRLQGNTVNTLTAFMGTGGLNTPMVASIQNTVIGRSDTAGPQGKGYSEEGEPMFTIDTTSPHAVVGDASVRRLTPTECERLQGFPDGWTEGQSDTHRYKQMGNAVAVPVVEWLIEGLVSS